MSCNSHSKFNSTSSGVNVLAPGEFVLALDSSEVAYKRADASVLELKTRDVAKSVCKIKGYSNYSRHVLAPSFSAPLVWKIEQGVLTQVPVASAKPWVFVKNPQMSDLEYFHFVKDLNFILTTFSSATAFLTIMMPPGSFQRAWDRSDPWAG